MHLKTKLILDSEHYNKAKVQTSAWVYKNLDGKHEVASIISIETGSSRTQNNLNAEETEKLIADLKQHLENIKEIQIDVMTKNKALAALRPNLPMNKAA